MSAAMVKTVTPQELRELIAAGPVVLKLWAPWCGPCKSYSPDFAKAAAESPDATFADMNVDADDEVAAFVKKLGVQNIPTTIRFEGDQYAKVVGRMAIDSLLKLAKGFPAGAPVSTFPTEN